MLPGIHLRELRVVFTGTGYVIHSINERCCAMDFCIEWLDWVAAS